MVLKKKKTQKVKFTLRNWLSEIKNQLSDKDIKSIVNYGKVVKLITKLVKNKTL